MLSTHTNTSLIKPHLTELDEIQEIDQNRIIILQKTCNRGHSWSVTSDIGHQTDPQTEIHTFFIWYPRVGREHNSPSGNKVSEDFLDSSKSFTKFVSIEADFLEAPL